MPVMDEFREEREAIKHGTFQQKYQYFKDYYRIPVIVALLTIVLIGSLIYSFVTHKDSEFYAAMLNCLPYEKNEWLMEEYVQYAGIDLDEYSVIFDTSIYYRLNSNDADSYAAAQKLFTYSGAGALDVMLGGGDEFAFFANSSMFLDLRTVLSEEQLRKYQPNLYYIDASLIDPNATEPLAPSDYANPKAPEDMENPMPVAVFVESSEKLTTAYYFQNADDGIALGIYGNSPHTENAVALIDYLLSD